MELAARREESGARKDQARVGRAARRRDRPAPGRREGVSEGRGRGRGGHSIRFRLRLHLRRHLQVRGPLRPGPLPAANAPSPRGQPPPGPLALCPHPALRADGPGVEAARWLLIFLASRKCPEESRAHMGKLRPASPASLEKGGRCSGPGREGTCPRSQAWASPWPTQPLQCLLTPLPAHTAP